MALAIPIITEFDGKGISKAITEFKNLETNGQKAHFAITKAALPATAALAGLTAALGASVKAAIEDAASQDLLAKQLQRTTNATDAQIAGVEDFITVQGKLLGVTDDQLRPALAGLVRATGSITEAQKAAGLAMDVAAAKGVSLETVTKTLERAYGGNFTALAKLSPELRDMIKEGASLDEVMAKMSETFGGAASDAANTAAGKFKRLKVSLDETKESIGAALLPAIEAILPYLQSFAQWAQDNPGAFLAIAAAIGVISAAIVTYTAAAKIATGVNALLATSFTALQVATGLIVFTAIIVGIIALYKNFEWFRNGIKNVVNGISDYFEFMGNAWIKAANILIRGFNILNPFKDVPPLGKISIGHIGTSVGGDGGNGKGGYGTTAPGVPQSTPSVGTPPKTAVTPPKITSAGGGGGTGDMSFGFGGGGIDFSGVTMNIDAGIISSPATVGQDIIDAILAAQRNSGTVFAPAT
jgi:molybdenum-dependent DNA-binding transcriptional regulator ModE